jgi:hypothetical protein
VDDEVLEVLTILAHPGAFPFGYAPDFEHFSVAIGNGIRTAFLYLG